MDLEGVTAEELQEAAAELTHLQTMALQGRALLDFQAPPVPGSEAHSVLPPSSDTGGCTHKQVPEPSRDRGPTQQVPQAERKGSRGEGATPNSHGSTPAPTHGCPERPGTINLVDHVSGTAVVDQQARIGAEWQQLKATNPSAISQPLRVILWQTWASSP